MTTTLLLVGRSGYGKSSVGNSILGAKLGKQLADGGFDAADRKKLGAHIGAELGAQLGEQLIEILDKGIKIEDCEKLLQKFFAEFQHQVMDQPFSIRGTSAPVILKNEMRKNEEFVLVDCSGVGDTGSDMAGSRDDVLRSALNAVKMCDRQSGEQNRIFQIELTSQNEGKILRITNKNSTEVEKTIDKPSNITEVENPADKPSNENGTEVENTADKSSNETGTEVENTAVKSSNETGTVVENTADKAGNLCGTEVENTADKYSKGTDTAEDIATHYYKTYRGFDALIFVMKFGVRYTKQEKDSVEMIKSIFGENVFQKWGIIVFTYGDNFYSDSQITFDDWCRQQTGDIKTLFEEVQYRCVIFDNKTVNLQLHNSQRSTLSALIDKVKERNVGRYRIDESAGLFQIQDKLETSFRSNQVHRKKEQNAPDKNINEALVAKKNIVYLYLSFYVHFN